MMNKLTVVYNLDDVILFYERTNRSFSLPVEGVKEEIKHLQSLGHYVVIETDKNFSDKEISELEKVLAANGIYADEVTNVTQRFDPFFEEMAAKLKFHKESKNK